jgi:hypothetical protein
MVRFQKGQPVMIYDDTLTETVDLSTMFDPYGAMGVLYVPGVTGWAVADTIPRPGGGWPEGAIEFVVTLNSGLDDAVAIAPDYIFNFPKFFNVGASFEFYIGYDVGAEKLYFGVKKPGPVSPGPPDWDLPCDVSDPLILEGASYRISFTWQVAGGSCLYELYINGALKNSGTFAGAPVFDDPFWFKTFHTSTTLSSLEIYTADVRLWNDYRTGAEILADVGNYLIGSEAGLFAYYKMDEGTGVTISDSTAGAHDGQLVDGGGGVVPAWGVSVEDWTGTFDGTGTHGESVVPYRWFTGRIESAILVKDPPDIFVSLISCSDSSARMDERLVTLSASGRKAGDIIKTYIPRYFSAEQIGCRTVSDGASITFVRLQFDMLKKALDDLRKASAFIWYVDAYKELRFHDPFGVPAPFDIDNSDPTTSGYPLKFNMEEGSGTYANRIIARAAIASGSTIVGYLLFIAESASAIADRAAIEGGSGIYEKFIDLPSSATVDNGSMLALGELAESLLEGTANTYTTRFPAGLRVGMTQHVTHSEYGIDDDFIIVGLEFSLVGGVDPQYVVHLSSSRAYKGLADQLRDLAESKSNFRPSGMYGILVVDTSSLEPVLESRIGHLVIGTGVIG